MRDITIRTVGAIVVLLGVTVAALMQMGGNAEPTSISLTAEEPTTPSTAGPIADSSTTPTTIEAEPFVYRVGVLSGVSASNFWAFYGEQASVWNAYILGPTKPALYALADTGGLEPELAKEVVTPVFDKNGWRVRIQLNDNFAWSDGTPITAHDFLFTFETVRSLSLGGSWADVFPASIESVHADSDYELRIEFVERPNLALWPHGPGLAPLMPAHIWASHVSGNDAANLYELDSIEDVGGGLLSIVEVTENRIVSVANPGYPTAAAPDRVEYHVFADDTAAVTALESGAIDTMLSPRGLTDAQAERLLSNNDVVVETSPANGIRYVGFNLDREPMSEPAFRTAVALLVDRDMLVEEIRPHGESTYTFVDEANPMWFDHEAANSIADRFGGPLTERLEAALEGLRSAGYSWGTEPTSDSDGVVTSGVGLRINGRDVAPLTILTTGDVYDAWRPRYAAEIAGVLGWLGFDVRPVETDFDTVVDLAFTPGEDGLLHYDMYLLGWTLGNPSLPSYYRTLFAADGAQNTTGYDSATFAAELSAYEDSFDLAEAKEALWAMERTLATDLPYLLLYSSSIAEAYRADQVEYTDDRGLGGLQARLGAIGDVKPAS